MNIATLNESELQDWQEYYIYLKYIQSYQDDLVKYTGPYISKEDIDSQIEQTKTTWVESLIEINKFVIDKILSSTVVAQYTKIAEQTSLYIPKEEDAAKVKSYLTPFQEFSLDILLKEELLWLHKLLIDEDENEDTPTSELSDFDTLPIYSLYESIQAILDDIKKWMLFNYNYRFKETLSDYICLQPDIDIKEIWTHQINVLNELFEDMLERDGSHNGCALYSDLLVLSQKIDRIDESDSDLWSTVKQLYANITELWDSISPDLQEKIKIYDDMMETQSNENEVSEEVIDPSEEVYDKLDIILYDFLWSDEKFVHYSSDIKNITCSFGDRYLSWHIDEKSGEETWWMGENKTLETQTNQDPDFIKEIKNYIEKIELLDREKNEKEYKIIQNNITVRNSNLPHILDQVEQWEIEYHDFPELAKILIHDKVEWYEYIGRVNSMPINKGN